jgi:hypothetical protein
MCKTKIYHFDHLDKLRSSIQISDLEHYNTEVEFIHKQLLVARNKWKACKKISHQMRQQFLTEKAVLMAAKMNTTGERP